MFPECPWCLEEDAFVTRTIANSYVVKCDGCGLTGPYHDSENGAKSDWNKLCEWEDAHSDLKEKSELKKIK